jgi:flagellar L-ring protein FlgH
MRVVALTACLLLAGCSGTTSDLGREPKLSSVGSGLDQTSSLRPLGSYPLALSSGSTLPPDDLGSQLFQDPRAHREGDLVTVRIAINDSASLVNRTDRSRDGKSGYGIETSIKNAAISDGMSGSLDLKSDTSSKGQGSTVRSERIELQIAAMVIRILPGGNLMISGSQEVRVNYELRMLNVGGIIRPQDISRDNSITYEKIAEARIAYGGKGRITEVQQPAYGQQILDQVMPF